MLFITRQGPDKRHTVQFIAESRALASLCTRIIEAPESGWLSAEVIAGFGLPITAAARNDPSALRFSWAMVSALTRAAHFGARDRRVHRGIHPGNSRRCRSPVWGIVWRRLPLADASPPQTTRPRTSRRSARMDPDNSFLS